MNSSSSKCLDISKDLCTSRPACNLRAYRSKLTLTHLEKEALRQRRQQVELSLWGVSLATSSRTQATQALTSAEAELYAMGMAIQDALRLQSFLQEMKLSQLAKPVELTVYTDTSSGKALASKLELTRKSKHVQLRYLFRKGLPCQWSAST